MLLTLILLAVLFIAGLINYFYYLPTKKLSAWFQSYFLKNNSAISTPTTVASSPNMQMMSAHKKEELKRVFATFDKNGDGFITKQELRESLKNIGMVMTEKDIEEIVEKLDGNGDGLLDLDEFCELFASMVTSSGKDGGKGKGILKEEDDEGGEVDLKEAFDVFDGDGDGLISVEELGLVLSSLGLKEGKKIEDCKEMIRKVDMDGDGMVNFEEFKRMMKGGGRLVSTS